MKLNQLVYDGGYLGALYKNTFHQRGTSQDGALYDEKNLHAVQCEHHTMHVRPYVAQSAIMMEAIAPRSKTQRHNFSSLLN